MTKIRQAFQNTEFTPKLEESNICDNRISYQQLIKRLIYLAILTRPDISYGKSFLSQFNVIIIVFSHFILFVLISRHIK